MKKNTPTPLTEGKTKSKVKNPKGEKKAPPPPPRMTDSTKLDRLIKHLEAKFK